MKKRVKSRRKPRRKLDARSALKFGPGYPSQKEYPSPQPKRGETKTSNFEYAKSYVWVGTSARTLTSAKRERIIRTIADRARLALKKPRTYVSTKLIMLFSALRPMIQLDNGDLVEIPRYDLPDDEFPDVGSQWEWRDWYRKDFLTRDINAMRTYTRKMFELARNGDQDADFVFIDSVELIVWTANERSSPQTIDEPISRANSDRSLGH